MIESPPYPSAPNAFSPNVVSICSHKHKAIRVQCTNTNSNTKDSHSTIFTIVLQCCCQTQPYDSRLLFWFAIVMQLLTSSIVVAQPSSHRTATNWHLWARTLASFPKVHSEPARLLLQIPHFLHYHHAFVCTVSMAVETRLFPASAL